MHFLIICLGVLGGLDFDGGLDWSNLIFLLFHSSLPLCPHLHLSALTQSSPPGRRGGRHSLSQRGEFSHNPSHGPPWPTPPAQEHCEHRLSVVLCVTVNGLITVACTTDTYLWWFSSVCHCVCVKVDSALCRPFRGTPSDNF